MLHPKGPAEAVISLSVTLMKATCVLSNKSELGKLLCKRPTKRPKYFINILILLDYFYKTDAYVIL